MAHARFGLAQDMGSDPVSCPSPYYPRPLETQLDYLRGNGSAPVPMIGSAHDRDHPTPARGRPAARMAAAAAHEPARPRARGRDLDQAPELPRDGALAAQPRDGAHLAEQLDIPLRERNVLLVAAGYAPVFAERTLEDPECRPRAGDGPRAGGPRALPGAGHRPPLEPRCRQRRRRPPYRRRRARPPAPARERPAPEPPSRGPRSRHREPPGVARPPPRAPAPADRDHRRSRARGVDGGALRLPGPLPAPPRAGPRDRLRRVVVPLQLTTPAAPSPSSARPRCSAPRSTSRSPSWRWSPSSPRTRQRPTPCAPSPPRAEPQRLSSATAPDD